jgi:hypothetical protein
VGVARYILSGLVAYGTVVELMCEFNMGLLLVIFIVLVLVGDVGYIMVDGRVVHNTGLVVMDHGVVTSVVEWVIDDGMIVGVSYNGMVVGMSDNSMGDAVTVAEAMTVTEAVTVSKAVATVAIAMVASDVDGSVLVGGVDQLAIVMNQWPCLHQPWPA